MMSVKEVMKTIANDGELKKQFMAGAAEFPEGVDSFFGGWADV